MSDLLEPALNNAALPHQPYVIVDDSPTCSGLPVMREMVRRSTSRNQAVVLVCVLRSVDAYLTETERGVVGAIVGVVDLTDRIAGYSTAITGSGDDSVAQGAQSGDAAMGLNGDGGMRAFSAIRAEIMASGAFNLLLLIGGTCALDTAGPGADVYIDAIDVLAEDYSLPETLGLVRALMQRVKSNKAPPRLTLLLSPTSPLHPALLPPTLSPSLTHLAPHPLALLTALSTAYLVPIGPSPRFLDLLDVAVRRGAGVGVGAVWAGDSGAGAGAGAEELIGDWARPAGPAVGGSGTAPGSRDRNSTAPKAGALGAGVGVGVQVTLRKATGGLKGMSRSLEGIIRDSASGAIRSVPLERVIKLEPFVRTSLPSASAPPSGMKPTVAPTTATATTGATVTAAAAHSALNLPFNLALTDEQRRRRDMVPVPYVHQGDGVEMGWEEEEEDEDDEEI